MYNSINEAIAHINDITRYADMLGGKEKGVLLMQRVKAVQEACAQFGDTVLGKI